MNLPRFSISRPVTIFMIYAAICMLGVISLVRLPIEMMPNFSFGDITIFIDVRGGIPSEEVEERVTKLVEDSVGTVSSLRNVLSISEEGRARVVLSFEPGTDMDFAALEVREKFSRVVNKLPPEIEKPVIAKFQQTDVPILIVVVTGHYYTPEKMRRLVDEDIKDKLLRVDGVANIEVGGGRERKILVEISEDRLSEFSLSINKVMSVLNLNNLNVLSGELDKKTFKYLLRIMGEFKSIDEIKNIPMLTSQGGSKVTLADIAEIKDSYLEPTSFARYSDLPQKIERQEVVSLYIQKESAANTVDVAARTLEAIKDISKTLDPKVRMIATYNQAELIKKAIKGVRDSLLIGMLLAVFVLWFFLMDVRSTIIIGVSIPISLIATFGIMYLQGLTLNIMTLSGLALGVGMLVDNSIVVLENIYHYVERGLSRAKAALIGTEEMLLPIVASTITTIVVFLPIIFVNKEIRILYSGLAMTVTYSLIVSLFVAVTFVPLLSSFRNRHIEMRTQRAVAQAHGPQRRRFTYRLKKWYMRFIGRLLRLRYLVIVLSVVAFIVAIVLYNTRLEKEFIGVTEPEDFTVFIELPTGAKLEISDYAVSDVEQLLAQVSEVKSYSSRVEPWSSKLYVKLVPITQRKRSTKDIIESLREQVNAVEKKYKEAFIYFEEQQEVETNEILLEIFGYNYDTLNELAVGMLTRMQAIEGLTDLKIRWRKGRPEWHLVVDKQKAALYGLTVEQISNILHAKLRGMRATLYHTEGKEVEVITRLENVDRQKLDQLRKLMIALPTGEEIALEQVVKFVYGIGPSKIWRKNKNRMIQVSANRGRYAFGTAAKKIEAVLKDMKFPEEYFYRFGDNYWRMIENQRQLTFALLLTVALIYLVLASLFESYFYPFVIMISVPLAIVGAVLGLLIFKKSVNIGALMGAMILGGVVVNNAIIFIDHFLSLLSQKTSYIKAIIRAGGDRFRPISMTVGTTILGLLPMAIDRSSEASLWSPLAITVMGGLISSTFLTLIVLPCILLVIKDLKKKRTVS